LTTNELVEKVYFKNRYQVYRS